MYVPDHFREDDASRMLAAMRAYPFAILVTHGTAGLDVTHLPTVVKTGDDGAPVRVEAHFARANTHWKRIEPDAAALLIFSGPHGYVSPGWYPAKAEHGKVVPTWNYEAIHAHGHARAVDDRDWLARHVGELTNQQEAGRDAPWATSDAPEAYLEVMLRGIVGLAFTIDRLEGKTKLNQNRSVADRQGVVEGLAGCGGPGDVQLAAAMRHSLSRDN